MFLPTFEKVSRDLDTQRYEAKSENFSDLLYNIFYSHNFLLDIFYVSLMWDRVTFYLVINSEIK